jgi:hypothetical protein
MIRVKTAVLAGVLGFSSVVFGGQPATAAQSDVRLRQPQTQIHMTRWLTYPVGSGVSIVRRNTGIAPSPARTLRDWSTGRDLTLAKPWLNPSR